MSDIIVLGAGTNGLTAAQVLARAGRRVLVLEQQERPAVEFDAGWIPTELAHHLDLAQHGLQYEAPDPWLVVPLDDGSRLELSRDMTRTAEAIRRLSPRDAERWPEFSRRMRRLASVLETLYQQPAPDVETTNPGELLRLGLLGLKIRGMGRQGIIDLLRVLPMSVAELLDEWFTSDVLKGALGGMGVMNLCQGPRSGGTAFLFLHHHVGCPAGVFRPPYTNLVRALELMGGVEIRRHARVRQIGVSNGCVRDLTLSTGEVIPATTVVSSTDPRHTLLDLLEPGWLAPEFARAVANIRMRGVMARVTLHCDRVPEWCAATVAPSLDFLERAYDGAKYNQASRDPWLDIRVRRDRIMVQVQYIPLAPADGAWDEPRKRALGERVMQRVVERFPEIAGTIKSVDVQTPADMQRDAGITGGHQYQGDPMLDQVLFMRPVPGWSRYRTPIGGLWLCGAGSHPGGAVAGAAGWLAARELLKAGT